MSTQDFTQSTPDAGSGTAGNTNTEGIAIQNTQHSATPHSSSPTPGAQGPEARPDSDGSLNSPEVHSHRSLAFWVKTVDVLVSREMEAGFLEHGASRRDWRLLNAVAKAADSNELSEHMRAKFARGGKRFESLMQRGLVAWTGAGWQLTAEGRLVRERLNASARDVRERVAAAVGPEDFDITLASLEAMASELGWAEGTRLPYRARREHEHGLGHGRGRGRRHSHEHSGCRNEDRGRGRARRCGCDHSMIPDCSGGHATADRPQRPQAFERGFAAGITAARHDEH